AVPDEDEAIRVFIGERPQKDAIEQAEDRGVGADAERQRQERDQREDWVLAERADRVTDILHWRLDGRGGGRVSIAEEVGSWKLEVGSWKLEVDYAAVGAN